MNTINRLLLERNTLLGMLLLLGMAVGIVVCGSDKKGKVSVHPVTPLILSDTVQTPSLQGLICNYQGRRYLNSQDYEKALQYFTRAAHLFKKKSLSASYANALRNMARVHLLSFRPDSALYYYLQAQKEVADFDPNLFMDISTELLIICRDVDDWQEAKEQILCWH